jgi:hypothetical protein
MGVKLLVVLSNPNGTLEKRKSPSAFLTLHTIQLNLVPFLSNPVKLFKKSMVGF